MITFREVTLSFVFYCLMVMFFTLIFLLVSTDSVNESEELTPFKVEPTTTIHGR